MFFFSAVALMVSFAFFFLSLCNVVPSICWYIPIIKQVIDEKKQASFQSEKGHY